GIASFECRTARKRRARRREAPLSPGVHQRPSGAPSPEDRSILADLEAAAREVLGALRREDAEAIAASVERGAAARFGLSPATFRKRLQRALERARLLWRTRHGHD
ncbi:MAG TPA: sigma-70 family RNA polymerase sigma factor, partial [Myxococcales bacterium]|nr:sigma-70 family RNA polymerase sigma factor [Myxococcales bacterium]